MPTEAQDLAARLRSVTDDERVLAAIAAVPRERFVPTGARERAYDDVALPIACEQTISQPTVVARMLALLGPRPGDRILDVGTGSGYHAALLARLGAHVWSVERHRKLSRGAAGALAELGIQNVTLIVGDGSAGLPDEAPFDAINLAAATDQLGAAVLEAQLAFGGRLVAPVEVPAGRRGRNQFLIRARRTGAGVELEWLDPVRFVPLITPDAA